MHAACQSSPTTSLQCPIARYLHGDPGTGLEWLTPLQAPVKHYAAEQAQHVADLLLLAQRAVLLIEGQPPTVSAFSILQSIPFYDRGLAAACLPCTAQYELDVAQAVLRRLGPQASLEQVSLELSGWRRRGLLYPLLVACTRMPSLQIHWHMPADLAAEPPAKALADLLNTIQDLTLKPNLEREQAAIAAFVSAQDTTQNSGRFIADVLDRVAVAMRVKSNASSRDEHYLDRCLDRLPRIDAMDAIELWPSLAHTLASCLPPTALSAPQTDTWGFAPPRYELIQAEQRLRFAPQSLQTGLQMTSRPGPHTQGIKQLQHLVQRLGRACLSPELAGLILSSPAPPKDPASILQALQTHEPSEASLKSARAALKGINQASPPPAQKAHQAPQAYLLAWKVETPRKVILFTGRDALASSAVEGLAPHTLPKLCLPDTSQRPELARITLLPSPPDHACIRAHILATIHAGALDTGYIERLPQAGKSGAQSTVLEEALLAFSSPPPKACHATVTLNGSKQWQSDHVDPRYAETQSSPTSPGQANSGLRYRDWCCVFSDDKRLEKCRLEAHALPLAASHTTILPWIQRGAHRGWVTVRSSIAFPDLAILTRSQKPDTLVSDLRARYFLNPNMLPVRSKEDTIERHNLAIYTHDHALCIAYSPTTTAQPRLEFVVFQAPAGDI